MEAHYLIDEEENLEGEDDYFQEQDEFLGEPHVEDLKESPLHMISRDYTLNSPLIADEIDEFIVYMKEGNYNDHFDRGNWSKRKGWMRSLGLGGDRIRGSADYHRWIISQIKSVPDSTQFMELFRRTDEEARDTFQILKAYLSCWIDLDVLFKSREDIDDRTVAYGTLHLHYHLMTMMINCATESEGRALSLLSGSEFEVDNGNGVFKYTAQGLGTFFIGYHVVYHVEKDQLLDRNMLLMIKDLCGGRFQTLMHCQYKQYPEYNRGHIEKIVYLFDSGDEVIRTFGSAGYGVIKMLEPICLEKMHRLASADRILLPELPTFGAHLNREKQLLMATLPESRGFFDAIQGLRDLDSLLTGYGSFRLWGHPFINYFEGLKKLHENVQMHKDIDIDYANQLASDLAYKVLHNKFLQEKKWYVNLLDVPNDHPLKSFIRENQWPSAGLIHEIGDTWHLLPLKKCFEIPDMIDPAVIYADKSHSPPLSELKNHILTGKRGPPVSKSVLESLLKKSATVWKEFLQRVNDEGLSIEQLIIALSAKEREIKDIGRFFALMSWELREYFVVTEYLIKLHFVPLFGGLTMADDLNTVTNKMLKATQGQSGDGYKELCIANHIDYSKWNNHQRGEGNNPVFQVMGKFLGYPNLISRTHEFFEKSLIYYKNRTDLMTVRDGKIVSKGNQLVCWNGQKGGLEGLRQKGWSIVNYLCIERQARIRSTSIRALAQGDNQVLCTRYKIRPHRGEIELRRHINDAFENNRIIMESIRGGTAKLGLIINENETLQSAAMMVYGKVIIFKGAFKCLSEKRLSRVLCTTNDQLPTLSSISGTVVTNCLTIGHYSDTPVNAMIQYNWLGNYSRNILELHDPAIKGPISKYQAKWTNDELTTYKFFSLFLDPSLGGVGGVSLNRFLIRQFPDPITESLSFWKKIREAGLSSFMSDLALKAGHPQIARFESKHFIKLVENPSGLNLPRGLSAVTVLRDRIRTGLLENINDISNHVIKSAVYRASIDKSRLVTFLSSIKPCFPRFVSEFYSATFMGVVEGILGLFENSRTIRNKLKNQIGKDFDEIIIRSEVSSIEALRGKHTSETPKKLWSCSSTHADELREASWGRKIVGATVPHPFELLDQGKMVTINCTKCEWDNMQSDYIAAIVPMSPAFPVMGRGPYVPYLGSRTSETTSMIQPWEKSTKVPVIRRCVELRDVICWFVNPESNLAKAILDNIYKLSGEHAEVLSEGYSRTGSALHRFRCSRQSNGGFSGVSPNLASWFILTTDTLKKIGIDNYDFMYQSLLIYSQVNALTRQISQRNGGVYHYHIDCLECLRKIDEPILDTPYPYEFPDMSFELDSWKPSETSWFTSRPVLKLPLGNWGNLNDADKSFHIGRLTGFTFGDNLGSKNKDVIDLFPIVLSLYLHPRPFYQGIVDGVYRSCCLSLSHRQSATRGKYHQDALTGNFHGVIRALARDTSFVNLSLKPNFYTELSRIPHRISPAYPASKEDVGSTIESYLFQIYQLGYNKAQVYRPLSAHLWVFSDFLTVPLAGPYILADSSCRVYFKSRLSSNDQKHLRTIANTDGLIRSDQATSALVLGLIQSVKVFNTPHELRSAAKSIRPLESESETESEENDFKGQVVYPITVIPVKMVAERQGTPMRLEVPDIRDPTISGLRLGQLATGSFYKFHSIIKSLRFKIGDFICGGDGSGGGTACILRSTNQSRGIFNSLMMGENLSFKGSTPAPPLAIAQMPDWISKRCVNLNSCWEQSSDLSQIQTWAGFKSLKDRYGLSLNFMLLDMELTSLDDEFKILHCIKLQGLEILNTNSIVIYKTYLGDLFNNDHNCLNVLGSCFERVLLVQTDISGSFTSEVYAIFSHQRIRRIQTRYVDWTYLRQQINRLHCFKTPDMEFQRALSLFNHRSLHGIPAIYMPDIQLELCQTFNWVGVDPSICSSLADAIAASNKTDLLETVVAAMIYAGENIFPTNRSKDAGLFIPSDQAATRWIAFLCGIHLWISLTLSNTGVYKRVHAVNQRSIGFSYMLRGLTQEGKCFFSWSLSKDYGRKKVVRLDSHQASQAKILRILTRLSVDKCKTVDMNKVKRIIRMFPYSKELESILPYSGVLDIFTADNLLIGADVERGFIIEPRPVDEWEL